MDAITGRLSCVEEVLDCYADDRPVESSTGMAIQRFAMVGTSGLRRTLQRSNLGPYRIEEIGAVVALVGRLVDLTANLTHFARSAAPSERRRIAKVAAQISEIRGNLAKAFAPRVAPLDLQADDWSGFPLLGEIEQTVLLISQCSTSERLKVLAPADAEGESPPSWFSMRALSNPEHVKFGLRGCLAATACYIIYNALFWPEIATAVTTCYLTALTTIGASHQKQVLRISGALIGGGIGVGARIWVLPYIDSIVGFSLLFIAVATLAAWIATSSARLSYLGVQVFVAFALINLHEFKFQTSLTVGRDRVIGILIGLFAMWICFDQLWSAPAVVAMRRAFTSSLRLLAQLAREPLSNDLGTAIDTSYEIRERINAAFEKARSLSDGILFEFGPSREADMKFRDLVRRWQPQLCALFLMRIASLKYRLQAPGFETPGSLRVLQAAYDARSADLLERMAKRVEDAGRTSVSGFDDSPHSLKRTLDAIEHEARRAFPTGRAESYLTLLDGIDRLTSSLAAEVAAEFAIWA